MDADSKPLTCCQLMCDALKVHWKSLILIVAPVAYLPIFLLKDASETRCLYVVILMFTYWMSECIPLPVTSFLPMILFPLMGIMDSPRVSTAYLKETNMLFLGGLMIAIAVEETGVHKRIALSVIICGGSNPRLICLGLASCTVFISMWISNTAALAMMIPIIDGCLKEMEAQGICPVYDNYTMEDAQGKTITTPPELLRPSKVTLCYYLTCCYSATIGGIGTIIGSGTNLTVKGIYETYFPHGPGISFASWMLLNVPGLIMCHICNYIWQQIYFMGFLRPFSKDAEVAKAGGSAFIDAIKEKRNSLGPWSFKEAFVTAMFLTAVLLWFFRKPQFMPGWPSLFTEKMVGDGSTAIIIAMILFTFPSRFNFIYMFSKNDELRPKQESEAIVTWTTIQKRMHWGVVFLLGGAFALADGIIESGTGKLMAQQLEILIKYHQFVIQVTTGLITILVTEFASNVAIANILLPVLAELSISAKVHPVYLCIPVGVFASFSFCLPVGTPPNALAKAAGNLPTIQMILAGFPIKIITFVIMIGVFNLWGPIIFGDMTVLPDWVNATRIEIDDFVV